MGRKHYKTIIGNTKKLQCVALGGRIPGGTNGGASDGNRTATMAQKLFNAGGRGGSVGGIRPMYSNWRLSTTSSIDGENTITIGASMLTPLTGFAWPYSFNGEIAAKLGRGANIIADFGFDFSLAPNAQFLIRSGAQVSTSGYLMPGGNAPASAYDIGKSHTDNVLPANEASYWGGRVNDNGNIATYAPTNGANPLNQFTPSCILGYSEQPQVAVLVVGDSNAFGQGDVTLGDGQGAIGYIERGLRSTASGVTAGSFWGRGGATLAQYTAGNSIRLFEAAEYHTHFLQQLSGNSISAGTSLATMKQLTVLGWQKAKLRNLRTIQLSSLPRVNTTNTAVVSGWEVGGVRDQYNSWAQSVVGQKIDSNGDISTSGKVYLDYYWDVLDLLQDPATNLFLSSTYISAADGTHLTQTGHTLAATRIATLANLLQVY